MRHKFHVDSFKSKLSSNIVFFQTLSPSKKASNDPTQTLEEKKVDRDVVDGNYVDEKTFDGIVVDEEAPPKKRVPRRILHFSDGILEEYRLFQQNTFARFDL